MCQSCSLKYSQHPLKSPGGHIALEEMLKGVEILCMQLGLGLYVEAVPGPTYIIRVRVRGGHIRI